MDTGIGTCITQEQIIEVIAHDLPEQFVFAKVDIHMEPELSEMFNIQNVPTTVLMKDRKPIFGKEGLMTDKEIRQLLKTHGVYCASDELRLQAREAHFKGNTDTAVTLLPKLFKKPHPIYAWRWI